MPGKKSSKRSSNLKGAQERRVRGESGRNVEYELIEGRYGGLEIRKREIDADRRKREKEEEARERRRERAAERRRNQIERTLISTGAQVLKRGLFNTLFKK